MADDKKKEAPKKGGAPLSHEVKPEKGLGKKPAAKKDPGPPKAESLGLDWGAIGAEFDSKYKPEKGLQAAGRLAAKVVTEAIKRRSG